MKCVIFLVLVASAILACQVDCSELKGRDGGNHMDQDGAPNVGADNPLDDLRMNLFKAFLKLYKKNYSADELPKRLEQFWKNRQKILKAIRDFNEGRSNFTMRENQFMDMTDEERRKFQGALKVPSVDKIEKERAELDAEDANEADKGKQKPQMGAGNYPAEFDWRQKVECVNRPPFNQGSCGSCWAAAARQAMEAARCIHKGSSPSLSHQQLVDCAIPENGYDCSGCEGGWSCEALKYWKNTKAIALDKCYPNTEQQDQCKMDANMPGSCIVKSSPTDSANLKYKIIYGEDQIEEALVNHGPVIVYVDVVDDFFNYGGGAYDGQGCGTQWSDIKHVVIVVGTTQINGKPYWILKNSWGENWGDKGYMTMAKDKNTCAIGHYAVTIIS